MTNTMITTKPVSVACGTNGRGIVGQIPLTPGGGACAGVLLRITLSRIEEGLGQEGFLCDTCGRKVKYIPKT
jgi:hypothetical protein